MLILKAISLGPLHGYGVLLRIQQISGDQLAIQQGSLYPALYRLKHQGLIVGEWGESNNNHKARFYRLTRPFIVVGERFVPPVTWNLLRFVGLITKLENWTSRGFMLC